VSMYVSNDVAEPTNDVGYHNDDEGLSKGEMIVLGLAISAAAAVFYNANKNDNTATPAGPLCPPGTTYNPATGTCN